MKLEMRYFALLAALALPACSSVGDVVGSGKDAPDEFAIVTKQPLIIPPDFYLHPPRPGSAPVNQLSPSDSAQNALFPDDPSQIAATIKGNYSAGEKLLLASAGAANANDAIRQMIAADNKKLEAADDSFTDQVLSFGTPDDTGHGLDADAEKARLDRAHAQGKPVATAAPMRSTAPVASGALPAVGAAPADDGGAPPYADTTPPDGGTQTSAAPADAPPAQPDMAGTLPDIGSTPDTQQAPPPPPPAKAQKDDSGWLDGIF
jgi:hypothetical protein